MIAPRRCSGDAPGHFDGGERTCDITVAGALRVPPIVGLLVSDHSRRDLDVPKLQNFQSSFAARDY